MINEKYVKVKIQGLFELDKLANKYNLEREFLREFHNSHCNFHEIIPKSLVNYLEYIYIPKTAYNEWNSNQVKSTFIDYPLSKMKTHYGFISTYFPQKLVVQNKFQIERNNFIVEISKEKTFVNNQELDLIIEQMLEKINETLYPLQLRVNKNGEFDEIINGVEVYDRWKK